jgi:hypothetical protein
MSAYAVKGSFVLLALIAWALPAAAKECTCRYFGQRVEIGAVACVNGRLAQCLMFQNNPSWKFISDTCPQAQNKDKPPRKPVKANFAAK